jgi:hypothetical protein
VYRFELFAAARSTTGYLTSPISVVFATANFSNPIIDIGLNDEPGIELVDFSIDVALDPASLSDEVAELKRLLESLREGLVSVGARVDEMNLEELLTDVNDQLAEQDDLIAALRLDMATEINALRQLLEAQDELIAAHRMDAETQISALRQLLEAHIEQFQNHTHEYLTGEGTGHNNTSVGTSPPRRESP